MGLQCFRGAIGREPEDDEMAKLMVLRQRYLEEEVEPRRAMGDARRGRPARAADATRADSSG